LNVTLSAAVYIIAIQLTLAKGTVNVAIPQPRRLCLLAMLVPTILHEERRTTISLDRRVAARPNSGAIPVIQVVAINQVQHDDSILELYNDLRYHAPYGLTNSIDHHSTTRSI
jgi:hypothetical protein